MNDLDARRLDAHITRERDESDLHCPICTAPLDPPVSRDERVHTLACSGQVLTIALPRSPEVAAIVGEGVDDVEYVECYSLGGEIVAHEPHEEVVAVEYTEHYVCPCGWEADIASM